MVRSLTSLIFCILAIIRMSHGQAPTANFTVESDYCLGEQIEPSNGSVNAVSYAWDVCPSSLGDNFFSDLFIDLENTTSAFGLDIVFDEGNYYTFVTNRDNSTLFRLDFQDSLGNTPTVTEVIPTGDGVSSPYDIRLVKQSLNWYGLISNGNNTITILDLGLDITNNTPSSTQYGGLGFNLPRGLEVTQENGDWIGVVSNFSTSKISIVNFGSDLSSPTPSIIEHPITGGTQLIGLDILKSSGIDIIVASFNGNVLYRLSLDDFTDTSATISTINESGLGLSSPGEVRIINQSDSLFVYVLNRNTGISRLTYLNDLATVERVDNLGNGGASGFINQLSMDFEKVGLDWRGLTMKFSNGELFSVAFPDNCQGLTVDPTSLGQEQLSSLVYAEPGQKEIALFAYAASLEQRWVSRQFNILTFTSPLIDFNTQNNCVSSPISFVPSTAGLTTYTWNFGDGSPTSSLETPSHTFSTPGTYTVRLDVNDGTCGNFSEQEITIYPEPPTPAFAPSETLICTNSAVDFVNSTDESQHTGVLTYQWDFDNDGTIDSTDPNPSFTYTTSGTKTVSLVSAIPGCESSATTIDITVSSGPTSSYTPSTFAACEGESISFTNTSSGSPISYSWDFGDGFVTTAENPDHFFNTAGSFNVALTTTDALGCQNTVQQEISIAAIPTVDFDFDVPCTSTAGTQFTDLSSVAGADIISRRWFVDNTEVSTDQNPLLTFSSSGTVNVRLETISSTGCENSYNEDILIFDAPLASFSADVGCAGEVSEFTDLSTAGGGIVSWLWTVEGMTYNTQNISHTFSGAGTFDVTLEVTGQNFCAQTITRTMVVLELPTVDFAVLGDCSNEEVLLSDNSSAVQDPIVSREWQLDGTTVGNGSQLLLPSLPNDSYDLTLQVTTSSGCVISESESIVINNAPQASLTFTRTFGIPGDELVFTNTSSGYSSSQWLLNGSVVSTNANEQSIQFNEPGTHLVSIVADNDLGCSDTLTSEVLIAIPEMDLSIGEFSLIQNGAIGSIILEVRNNSNLPLEIVDALITLENQFSVTERVEAQVGIGQSQLVSLNVGIPLGVSELSYLCVTLNSQYTDYPDIAPIDNEKCIAVQPRTVVEAPFPNPTRDNSRIKIITDIPSTGQLTIINASGRVQSQNTINLAQGLNNFFVDLSTLTAGTYFVRVQVNGTVTVHRIIKL